MKVKLINSVFKFLQLASIDYVVLRNFTDIPNKITISNDLELLICHKNIDYFHEKMISFGFEVFRDQGLYLYGARPHFHFVIKESDLHIDVVDGLFYRSLMNRKCYIKADDYLQKTIFARKITLKSIWKYRPSHEDLLTHLCCHCIFDKNEVSDKYEAIINEEYAKSDKELLLKYFEKVFFKASALIMENISSNNTRMIYGNYIKYNKY